MAATASIVGRVILKGEPIGGGLTERLQKHQRALNSRASNGGLFEGLYRKPQRKECEDADGGDGEYCRRRDF